MRGNLVRWGRLALGLAGVAAVAVFTLSLTACEEEDDFDHDPPAGKGTLYIDNETWNEIKVYIDGTKMESVDAGDNEYYDLNPGVRRVALDESNGDREWAGDVDILEGRRVIMTVEVDSGDNDDYDIDIDED